MISQMKFHGRPGYQIGTMSDLEKRTLCYDLLVEFGAKNITEKGDEISHSCCLPFGLHANGDSHPSANLNWRKLVYSCFGCGSSGGLFWFVSSCRGETVAQVRDWAVERTSADTEDSLQSLLDYLDVVYNPQGHVEAPIPRYNEAILKPWMKIHPYLTEKRHILERNIILNRVGYDERTNRIVFPHFWKDDLVGWQTRRIIKDGTAKYLNSSDFPREKTLYNWGLEREVRPVIVESPMSVLAKCHVNPDRYQFVSTFGAKVTDQQKEIISERPTVILWFDNDQSGWTATRQVGDFLTQYCDVLVVVNPWNEDPAGLPDAIVVNLIETAKPYMMWKPPVSLEIFK